jgi:hypothetical protein
VDIDSIFRRPKDETLQKNFNVVFYASTSGSANANFPLNFSRSTGGRRDLQSRHSIWSGQAFDRYFFKALPIRTCCCQVAGILSRQVSLAATRWCQRGERVTASGKRNDGKAEGDYLQIARGLDEGVDGRNVIISRKELNFDLPFTGLHFIEHNVITLKRMATGIFTFRLTN